MSLLYVTWRKAIRKIFDLPYITHCDLLPTIADCKHIEIHLLCRLTRFIKGDISCHNVLLNVLIEMAMSGSSFSMSNSIKSSFIKVKSYLSHV